VLCHGLSTFAREGDAVYHCYSSYARTTEFLMGYYAILDRAPMKRGWPTLASEVHARVRE
jgi:predicted dithiol-disulfide oxidoreductase (DUF899 family)